VKSKLAAAFTAVVLAGSGLAVIASPAQAVTTVSISAPNVSVRLNACGHSRVTIAGDWASDPYNSIDVSVTGPDGDYVAGDYWFDEVSGSLPLDVELCGYYDTPGQYAVTVRAEGFDENYDNQTVATAAKAFTFTKVDPRARAAITKKAKRIHGKYRWKVTGRLFRAGHSYVGRRVAIQAVIAGDWTYIEGQRTKKKGRFGWKFKPNRYTWRYVFSGNASTKPAVTKAFRTPRKGRGGREASADPQSLIT
jgi:hypothetical protein